MAIRRMGGTGGPGSRGGGGSIELAAAYISIMPETSKLAPGVRRSAQQAAAVLDSEISSGMQRAFQRGQTYSTGFAKSAARDSLAVSKGYDDVINKVTAWQQAEERLTNVMGNKKSKTDEVTQATLAADRTYRAMENSVESLGIRMATFDANAAKYAQRQVAGEQAKASAAETAARRQQVAWQRNLSASQTYLKGQEKFSQDFQDRLERINQSGTRSADSAAKSQQAIWQRNLNASQRYMSGQEKFMTDSQARMKKLFDAPSDSGGSMAAGFRRAQTQMRQELEYTASQGETRWRRMSATMALSNLGPANSLRSSMSSALDDVEARAGRTFDGMRRGMLDAMGAPLGVRSTAAGAALLGSYAVFSGVDRVLSGGMNRLETIQNAQVAMNAIIGNQKEATDLINQTVALAQGTPYTAAQFLSMARDMSTMGVASRQVVPSIQALADAMSLQGKGPETLEQLAREFGKIQAEGRITSRDALELQRVGGINVRGILANAMNIDTEDLVKKMSKPGGLQVDPATIIDMLVKGIEQGTNGPGGVTPAYGGGMEAIRKTVTGSMSVLQAQMDRIGAAFLGGGSAASGGPADPNSFFGRLPGALNNVSDQFKTMANPGGPIDQFMAKISGPGGTGGPLDLLIKGFEKLPDVVKGTMGLANTFMDAWSSPTAQKAIGIFKQDLSGIWGVVKELAPTFLRLGGNIAQGFGGVGLTGLTIFTDLLKTVEPLISGITGIFADNKGIVEGAIGIWALMAIRAKVAGAAMSGLSKITGAYNKQIYDFGTNTIQNESIWNRMAQNYRTAADGADGFSKSLRTAYSSARTDGDGFVSAFRSGVVGAFRSGTEEASGFSTTARGAFASVKGAAREMGSGLIGALGGPWGAAITVAVGALSLLAGAHEKAAAQARQQKQDEDALRGTLEQNTALMTEQTYAAINKQLSDNGALKKAQELGIDPHQIFQAGIGDDQSYGQFRGAASAAIRGQLETKKTSQGSNLLGEYARVGISEDQLVSALLKEGNAYDLVNSKMNASALTVDGSIPSLDNLTQIISDGAGKYVDLAQAINAARFNTTAATEAQRIANEAMYGTWKATQAGTDAMHQFGASIDLVPNNKSILLTADTPDAIAKMKDAGYEIQEIPGTKQFVAIPNTDEAKAAFLALIQQINAAPPPQIKPQIDPTGAIGQGVQLSQDLKNILGDINIKPSIPPGGLPSILLPGQNLPVPPVATAPPPGPRRATGGRLDNFRISGPGTGTSDSISAMVDGRAPINVSNEESINTAKSTADNWWLIDRMNKGLRVPHFAGGGLLGGNDSDWISWLTNPQNKILEWLFGKHGTQGGGSHRGPGGIPGYAGGGWFDWYKKRGAAGAHGTGSGSASNNVRERAGQTQAANLANPGAGPHDANYYGNQFFSGFGQEGANSATGLVSALGNPSSIYQGLAPLAGLGGPGAPGVGQSWKDFGKNLSHWDQWSTDAAGAAGAIAFDFGSLPFGEEGAAGNITRDALDATRSATKRAPIAPVVSSDLRNRVAPPYMWTPEQVAHYNSMDYVHNPLTSPLDDQRNVFTGNLRWAWTDIPQFNASAPFMRQGAVDAIRNGYGGLKGADTRVGMEKFSAWNEAVQDDYFAKQSLLRQSNPLFSPADEANLLLKPQDVAPDIQEILRTNGRELASLMVHSPATEQSIFRGMGLTPEQLALIKREGTLSFPLSSFTPERDFASAFSKDPAFWQKTPPGSLPVLLRLQKGAQAANISGEVGADFQEEFMDELLTQGRFDVRGIKGPQIDPRTGKLSPHEIVLRQRSLDPSGYDLKKLMGYAKGGMILAQGNDISHHFGKMPKTRFAGGGRLLPLMDPRGLGKHGSKEGDSPALGPFAPWWDMDWVPPVHGEGIGDSIPGVEGKWWHRGPNPGGRSGWRAPPLGKYRKPLPGQQLPDWLLPHDRAHGFAGGGPLGGFKTDEFSGSSINRDDYSSHEEWLNAWNLARMMGFLNQSKGYSQGGAPGPGGKHAVDPLMLSGFGTNLALWFAVHGINMHQGGQGKFSSGGKPRKIHGMGGGRSDHIPGLVGGQNPILVSNGESINTTQSTNRNWHAIDAMNSGAVITPQMLRAMGIRGYADGDSGGGGGLGAAYQTGYAMNGKPYANSFGDGAADCSGFVSMIVNAATGMGVDGARMTTQTAGAWLQAHGAIIGNAPGPGFLQVGWYNNGPGIQDGHMAGTMPDGTNFEAGGKDGVVKFGGDAAGANSSEFKQHAWFPYTALYPDGNVTVPPGSPPSTPYGNALGAGGIPGNGVGMTPKQMDALNNQLQQAGERVASTQNDIDIAQQHITDLQNSKTPPKPATMDRAEESLRKAQVAHSDAVAKQGDLQQKASTAQVSSGGGKGGAGAGQSGGDELGKDLVGGIFQSLGIDGSVFSDPRQWAGVKSIEALINWFTKPVDSKSMMGMAQQNGGLGAPGGANPYASIGQPAPDARSAMVDQIVKSGLASGANNNVMQASIMAGLQESGLTTGATNGQHVGPFQMDAAKGTEEQRRDPAFASDWWMKQAMAVPGHENMDPGQLAEAVEHSGQGQRYGPHSTEAQNLLQQSLARMGGGSQHGPATQFGPGPGNYGQVPTDASSFYNPGSGGGGGGDIVSGLLGGVFSQLGLNNLPGLIDPKKYGDPGGPFAQSTQGAPDLQQFAPPPDPESNVIGAAPAQFAVDPSMPSDQGAAAGGGAAAMNTGNVTFNLAKGATLGWDPNKTFSRAQSYGNMKTNQAGGSRTVML